MHGRSSCTSMNKHMCTCSHAYMHAHIPAPRWSFPGTQQCPCQHTHWWTSGSPFPGVSEFPYGLKEPHSHAAFSILASAMSLQTEGVVPEGQGGKLRGRWSPGGDQRDVQLFPAVCPMCQGSLLPFTSIYWAHMTLSFQDWQPNLNIGENKILSGIPANVQH